MAASDPPRESAPAPAHLDLSSLTNGRPAMAYALQGLNGRRLHNGSEDSWTPEASSVVSEDDHGGPLKADARGAPAASTGTTAVPSDGSSLDVAEVGKLGSADSGRRKSVQVFIEESGRRGRFVLRADDPEFRDVLRAAIEREAAKLRGKGRSRIRDLVFTRQFTTFDRQNPRGAQSPFHGFFTLFWLAMALLLIKIAAQNYRQLGSVFGRAEILHLMIDRDLFVLLATDGLMCLSTVFCLVLQKAIAKEYLTWDRSGWILQSLWQMVFTTTIIWISFYRDWPWTHTVFIVMHDFVLLMKQHSYSFYNGYRTLSPHPFQLN